MSEPVSREQLQQEIDGVVRAARDLRAEIARRRRERSPDTRRALEESVKLQSHYAELLNHYDAGKRRIFASADEWIARLREIGTLPPETK